MKFVIYFPCLYRILFWDSATNNLKKFIFVVDNGLAKPPSSSLLQLCLVQLLKFLKLQQIIQVSQSTTPKETLLNELMRKKIMYYPSMDHFKANLYTNIQPMVQRNI